jgi:hypothetical protein
LLGNPLAGLDTPRIVVVAEIKNIAYCKLATDGVKADGLKPRAVLLGNHHAPLAV